MRFDVLTIFPGSFQGPLAAGLLGRAIGSGLVEVHLHDLRDWSHDAHGRVDDEPFGGGPGMVMRAQPVVEGVEAVRRPGARVLVLTPAGRVFDQRLAAGLAASEQVILVCGRYEGIDDRVIELCQAEPVSVGDFVLMGGEAAALVVIEVVARLIPGTLGNAESLRDESHSERFLEYPQYTRPETFRGVSVPEVLLSGDHARIARWRQDQSLLRTRQLRPDLIEKAGLAGGDPQARPDPDP